MGFNSGFKGLTPRPGFYTPENDSVRIV